MQRARKIVLLMLTAALLGTALGPPAVRAAGWSVTANPSSLPINRGSSFPSTITVTNGLGFNAFFLLKARSCCPADLGLAFSSVGNLPPGILNLFDGASDSLILTIDASGASVVLGGTYVVTVDAWHCQDFLCTMLDPTPQTVLITVTIPVTDFIITATPLSPQSIQVDSTPGTSTVTVTSLNGFSGIVTLTAAVFRSPPPPSNSPVMLPICNPQPIPPDVHLSATTVDLTSVTTGESILTVSTTITTVGCFYFATGMYTVTLTATSGSVTHSTTVDVNVVDFSVTVNSSLVTFEARASATRVITVTGQGGFTGAVLLSATPSSSNLTADMSPRMVQLYTNRQSATSTLTLTSTSAGYYTVPITGTSNGVQRFAATISVNVLDFSIAANASSISTNVGVASTSEITVTPVYGFGGVVTLTSTVSPMTGLTCLTLTSVTGSGASTLSCTASLGGTFTVTVTGTSGTLSHTAVVTYTVQDFSVSASQVSAEAGFDATSLVTVTGLNGFGGTVRLTSTVSSSGLTCSLGLSSITLSPTTTSGTASLSCKSLSPGTFTVMLTGTMGSLAHTTSVTVTVTVDKTPPVITISSPSDGSVLTSTSVTVSGTASDNVAVARVEISKDGNNWVLANGTVTWSDWHGSLTLSDGANTIYARATDTSGIQTKLSFHVTVQTPSTTPPSGTSTSPSTSNPIIDFLTSNLVWLILAGVAVVFAVAILLARRGKTTKLKT